jgi:D-ribose pyranose/furanose isomerase RbsD
LIERLNDHKVEVAVEEVVVAEEHQEAHQQHHHSHQMLWFQYPQQLT